MMKHRVNSWRFEFFGWDCPILKIETPWFDIVFDGRVDSVSKCRDEGF